MALHRTAPKAVAAAGIRADPPSLASLPLPLAHRLFLALRADDRGRASCVCRAWRDVLADPSLWTRLDMSGVYRAERGGTAEEQRFDAVLLGAVGRARGLLSQLDLSRHYVSLDTLLPVLTANAGSLHELYLDYVNIQAVLVAAPLLQVLAAERVHCEWEDAPRMLRAEPPLGALQMRRSLSVGFRGQGVHFGGMERFGPFAAALADAALQPALSHLCVQCADTAQPALMGALVDAALARQLRELTLDCCKPPAAAPLARLLAEGSLAVLVLSGSRDLPPFDAAGAALVADALRVNTTLTMLRLAYVSLSVDMHAAELVLDALKGHPSLRELQIHGEEPSEDGGEAFGAALGALIAADAPALHVLDCCENDLEDGGLAPIVEALELNSHLRELDVSENCMSNTFAREQLLPAVRANTTLRALKCVGVGFFTSDPPAAAKAEDLVRRRGQQG